MNSELGSREQPLYFKFLRDEQDNVDWTKILLMLGLTIASGYLAAKSQRWGASSMDPIQTLKVKVAHKRIQLGHNLQKVGREIEEAGWRSME